MWRHTFSSVNCYSPQGAIEDYFAAQTAGGTQDADMADEDDLDAALAASAAEAAPTGGARTLSGAPAGELPPEWANRGGRITTIGAMVSTKEPLSCLLSRLPSLLCTFLSSGLCFRCNAFRILPSPSGLLLNWKY